MLLDFDAHVHTEYCGHAQGMTVSKVVETSNCLNLKSLLIAEHIFSPKETALINKIKDETGKIDSQCKIFVGVEVDVDASKTDGSLVTTNESLKDADLVIAAVHYIPGVGNYPRSPMDNPLEPEKLLELWRSSLLGMLANPVVDILAHPGRLPAAALDLDIYFDDMISVLREAAEISADNAVAWEINNLTCGRLTPATWERWHETIQAAIDAGVKITYGSDAHSPEEISKQGYVQQIIKKLKNFTGFVSPADIMKYKYEAKN
jgi:histidinol phosphatase-like PHP family hydrolase